eukprot:scaffold683_cov164-Amphora_coffeaeformis.AAC.3
MLDSDGAKAVGESEGTLDSDGAKVVGESEGTLDSDGAKGSRLARSIYSGRKIRRQGWSCHRSTGNGASSRFV